MRKEAVGTGRAPLSLPFSPGIRLGNLLFVSGQGPVDQHGNVLPGDIKVHTRTTLENFRRIVESSGTTMDNVLQTTVYLRDLSDFQGMNEIYSSFFREPRPSRTTVQAGLLFGMLVEIQGIVYIPE
ncbi:MAG TPA: RidA family protein [Candidatus Bathyarchaeia archaeon]|nr:RidA family protein [Candidatus Bathyarchaeia archaeon]